MCKAPEVKILVTKFIHLSAKCADLCIFKHNMLINDRCCLKNGLLVFNKLIFSHIGSMCGGVEDLD